MFKTISLKQSKVARKNGAGYNAEHYFTNLFLKVKWGIYFS